MKKKKKKKPELKLHVREENDIFLDESSRAQQ